MSNKRKLKAEDEERKKMKVEVYCFLCQIYGHDLSEECVASATCFNCGRKGHIRRDCNEDRCELKNEIKLEKVKEERRYCKEDMCELKNEIKLEKVREESSNSEDEYVEQEIPKDEPNIDMKLESDSDVIENRKDMISPLNMSKEYIEKDIEDKKNIKVEVYCFLCQIHGHAFSEACLVNVVCVACGVKGHVGRDCKEEKCELKHVKLEIKNDCANYSENFRGGFKPSFGENARDSHCGINYMGINREIHNGQERRTDSDWTGQYLQASGNDGQNKVEESYSSKKSIEDCLLEGSVVVVEQQRGRPKYKCLHCKITFFNEDHIERKGHLGHVEHCLDVRDCFEATVGKRGFGLNFKKLSSQTNEGLKAKKVKTEPYQNAYEKDYIEKNIKEESEGMKQEAKEKDFRCNLGRLKEMTSQERVQNYVTNQIKEEVSDIDVKREIIKTEIAEKNIPENNGKHHVNIEEAINLAERQAQEKKKEPQKILKEIRKKLKEKKKKKMAEKIFPENNEKHHVTKEEATNLAEIQAQEKKKERQKRLKENRKSRKEKKKKKMKLKRAKARERDEEKDKAIFDKEVKAVTRCDQYACLKPECLETFQVWGDARRHMRQGCLPGTVKPNMGQSREKAQNQHGMGTSKLKPVPDENEEKLVEAAKNFYVEKQNCTLYPTNKEVVRHLWNTYRGFGLHPARIHQIVKSLSNP